jgi:hypothetical protein
MAREVAADISDSEPDAVTTPKRTSTNGEKAPMAVDDDKSEEPGSDADSGDGSEYEIESILGAKRSGAVRPSTLFLRIHRLRRVPWLTHTVASYRVSPI